MKKYSLSIIFSIALLLIYSCKKQAVEESTNSGNTADFSNFIKTIKQKSAVFIANYKKNKNRASQKTLSTLEDPHNSINTKDFLGEIHNKALDTVISKKTQIFDSLVKLTMTTRNCGTCTPVTDTCSKKVSKLVSIIVKYVNTQISDSTITYNDSILNIALSPTTAVESNLDILRTHDYMTSDGESLIMTYEAEVDSMEDYELIISYSKYFEGLIHANSSISSLDKDAVFSYVAISKFSSYYWGLQSQSSSSPWGPLDDFDPYTDADRDGCIIWFEYCTTHPDNPFSNGWGNGANHGCATGAAINSALSLFGFGLIPF